MGTVVRTAFICLLSWNIFANGLKLSFTIGNDNSTGDGSKPNEAIDTPTNLEGNGGVKSQSSNQSGNDGDNSGIDITLTIFPGGEKSAEKSSDDDNNDATDVTVTVLPGGEYSAATSLPNSYEKTKVDQQQEQPRENLTNDITEEEPQPQKSLSNSTSEENQDRIASSNTPQPQLQLEQVTVSQILYHMNMQYEKMYKEEGNGAQTSEVLETFLSKMLTVSKKSETVSVEGDKNGASTTYAAYYSTEYAYTFALCKLHHLTGGPKDKQNKINIDPKISSQCSEVVEKFSTFSSLYEQVVTTAIASDKGHVSELNDGASDKDEDKTSISNNEVIGTNKMDKEMRGYNDDKFFSKSRSQVENTDKYDVKSKQNFGNSSYSAETVGKTNKFYSVMDSDIRAIPKSAQDDSEKSLRKISNTVQITDEANTKERTEDAEFVTDTNRLTKYAKSQKDLDEFARNYGGNDNEDIGGNIPNAKLQDEEVHYSTTVEQYQDVDEQIRKPKPPASNRPKYTFPQVVSELLSYIKTVHVFVESMDEKVEDKKASTANDQEADIYTEMYTSIYEEVITSRTYLRKYFTNYVNVENGTFNGYEQVDMETETKILETTVERYSWVQNSREIQNQTKDKGGVSKSNPIELLWYCEEAGFYLEYQKKTKTDISFMSYLPYPDFEVKINQDNEESVDIEFNIIKIQN